MARKGYENILVRKRKGNPIFVSLIAFVKLFFYVTPFFRLLLSYCWGGGVTGGLIFSMGSESSSSFYQWLLDSLQDREVEEVNSLLSPEVAQRLPGSNPIEIPPQDVNQEEVWREVHARSGAMSVMILRSKT